MALGRLRLAGWGFARHIGLMPDPVAPAAAPLLRWYDRHRRSMPWRALPGESVDPYRVWLSEIMLQQTTVAAVTPYFHRFLDRFPTVEALAEAPVTTVMELWAGLGYYARARNMHACARRVVELGGFPDDVAGLRALPGVGAYTAAAVASIAFGVPVVPVDGNVERVVARVFAIDTPLPGGKPTIAIAAARLGRDDAAISRPADFTQALFDLGATICTPRNPACALCPWRDACRGLATGSAGQLPIKAPRRDRPVRHGAVFLAEDPDGRVLLRRRPDVGLLGGMLELPGTPWRELSWAPADAVLHAPQPACWRAAGLAVHGFTHFELRLIVYVARVERIEAEGMVHEACDLEAAALPSVMRRCLAVAASMRGSSCVKVERA